MIHRKMEENQIQTRIITEEKVQIENTDIKFKEPEWMKILRGIIEQKQQSRTMEKKEMVTFCNQLK